MLIVLYHNLGNWHKNRSVWVQSRASGHISLGARHKHWSTWVQGCEVQSKPRPMMDVEWHCQRRSQAHRVMCFGMIHMLMHQQKSNNFDFKKKLIFLPSELHVRKNIYSKHSNASTAFILVQCQMNTQRSTYSCHHSSNTIVRKPTESLLDKSTDA